MLIQPKINSLSTKTLFFKANAYFLVSKYFFFFYLVNNSICWTRSWQHEGVIAGQDNWKHQVKWIQFQLNGDVLENRKEDAGGCGIADNLIEHTGQQEDDGEDDPGGERGQASHLQS